MDDRKACRLRMKSEDQNLQAPWVGKGPEDIPFADVFVEEIVGTCAICGQEIYETELFFPFGRKIRCYSCADEFDDY